MKKYNLKQLRGSFGAGIAYADSTPAYFKLNKKWFHSIKSGQIHWQGQVLDYDPSSQTCLVQTYDWIAGYESDIKLVPIQDMVDWIFYETDKEMRDAYKYRNSKGIL